LPGTEGADIRIRSNIKILLILATAKDLGGGIEFEVDFESDCYEVVHV